MKNYDHILLLTLLCSYTAKVGILGASLADAAVVLVLAAAHFLYSSQVQNKQVTELKEEVSKLKEQSKETSEILLELKSSIASAKLAAGMSRVK